ncbi:hypothetical protein VTJ83DRAFT_6654 [Remersonia thermophila]|uniref:NADP-dependent oxidoreductase domain-containing protein n=1 Tax=Remersonia thermophila TaxID=72144 RepID=A0ABR4D5C7_9PEZI
MAAESAPEQPPAIPTFKLSDGNEIPVLSYGLGTARFKRGSKDVLDESTIEYTLAALRQGYYHLDCAEVYGNEAEVGAALSRANIPRSKLYITTKSSCTKGETIDLALTRSLRKLGTDYVDLYLIHSPFWAGDIYSPDPEVRAAAERALQEKWAEMEAAKDSGRVRSIGVSNFLKEHLEAVLKTARYPPVVNQIEFHPYLQHHDAEGGLLGYLKEKGIVAEAYGPLTAVTKAAPGPLDEVYESISKKHGVTPAEVALRWCVDQGVVAITTSAKEERLRGWVRPGVLGFELTKEEVEEIAQKGREKHFRGFWNDKFKEDDRR